MYDWNLSFPILFVVVDGYGMILCASDPVVALLALCTLVCYPIQNHGQVIDVHDCVTMVVVDRLLLVVDLQLHALLSLLDTVGQSQY